MGGYRSQGCHGYSLLLAMALHSTKFSHPPPSHKHTHTLIFVNELNNEFAIVENNIWTADWAQPTLVSYKKISVVSERN